MLSCNFCNFTCKYESEYKRHLNSKKHKKNIESKNLCEGCFKEFSTKYNKQRHEKSCKDIQNINIQNNIETQNNTHINTQNNIETQNNTHINIILPENPEAIKTFFILIEDLKKKKTTDCFQKLILDDMITNNFELMDYIDKFDKKLEENYDNMINKHNSDCRVYESIHKVDENGKKYIERIHYAPITHPEYKFECFHERCNFKLNEDIISKLLIETILDIDDKIVVTHENDIHGKTDILFKHKDKLYSDNILLEFLDKSNKKHLCNLSEDFKPASIIKHNYPEYYDRIEDKAIKIIQAYGKKTKK
jgi:hypothetical protein